MTEADIATLEAGLREAEDVEEALRELFVRNDSQRDAVELGEARAAVKTARNALRQARDLAARSE